MTAMDPRDAFLTPAPAGEAAPGVMRHDVTAVEHRTQQVSHYKKREKIHPKRVRGTYRNLKWAAMVLTLGVYYILPWLRMDRGEGRPSQAFLLDFEHQRLFFGPIEIWAQEFYYVTGILIASALFLFLLTAIAGRVWCGYACPQTVWTDLMVAVERFWQGDRNTRIRRDQTPWAFSTLWRKAVTHTSWLFISLATGGALIFYFRDAPTLAMELVTGTAPAVAYAFLGIFTVSTYLLGGIAREQVCIYMCPWPRIQGAMLDKNSLLVSYREGRGEPRSPHKKGQSWDGRGDCIDCKACVAVCPMGIDIRNGPQLECIQCALCIDACNEIMDKVDRPRGLIDYTTMANVESPTAHPRADWRLIRPRTVLYTVLISAVITVMTWALGTRSDLDVSVLPDRNPLFVTLSNGDIRNGYTVKLVNKAEKRRKIRVTAKGFENASMTVVGHDAGTDVFEVAHDGLQALKVYITIPKAGLGALDRGSAPLNFEIIDTETGFTKSEATTFRGPAS